MTNKLPMLISLFSSLFLYTSLLAQDGQDFSDPGDAAVSPPIENIPAAPAPAPVAGDLLARQQTAINNPFDMRDPFKRNLPKRGRLKKNLGNRYYNGQLYTNIDSIEGVPLEQIRVVGVLLGNNRRAIVKLVDPELEQRLIEDPNTPVPQDVRTFVVKEGMKLGIDGAEVRAILPGGIVLVEKIRNVYDQDEFLETIIPVSE